MADRRPPTADRRPGPLEAAAVLAIRLALVEIEEGARRRAGDGLPSQRRAVSRELRTLAHRLGIEGA